MARHVRRDEILDFVTYEEKRAAIQSEILEIKKLRRVHVGEYLTFLFENTDTARYQIHEIVRAEKIVKEEAIQHEIAVYNEMLGTDGSLGCVLLIEIEDAAQRKPLLEQWLGLSDHIYVEFEDGEKAYAKYDERQVGEDRLSAVQYLHFEVKGRVPVNIGTDFASLAEEVSLSEATRDALASDLANTSVT